MEQVIEIKTDYMLRYRAEIPADEAEQHKPFWDCPCKPEITFDEKEGWRYFKHNRLSKICSSDLTRIGSSDSRNMEF